MFACLIAGATTSVAYAAGEHTGHSGWNTLSGTLDDRALPDGNYVLTDDLIFTDLSYSSSESTVENIVWCLNGHQLVNDTPLMGTTPAIVNSSNGRVFTICDCTGKGSVDSLQIKGISLSNVSLYNSLVYNYNNTVTTIDGNTKIYSGEVYASYDGNMIIGGNTYIETGVIFTVENNGHLIINGGTVRCDINVTGGTCDISGGTFYGAINVSGGTCNITGGTFSSPINVSGGTCNITGGKISTSQYYNDDPGTPQGAVVVNTGGTCTIGGTAQITGNRVDYGGAVCVNGGTCTISGNNITKNNVSYGGVYVVDGICNIEKDAVISGNKSSYNGGGVYMRNGTCNIRGTITDNYTDSYCHGGGVYVLGGTCNISSTGTVKNNSATLCGGGVYVASGKCDIYGTVQGNKAEGGDGGGVYVKGGTCSIYAQSIIQKNTATHSGGGVYVADSQSVFIAGTIDSNIANENGGGVCLISNASLELNGSIVNNSTATGSNPGNGGGIYCGSGCSLTLQSATVITGNKAYGQGGGIYLNGTAANPCTVTFNANTLSSVQQNSIVLNTSSCTLAGGKWETDQIGPYFELQDGGEIIIAGGYYSTDPAQQFTIADTVRAVQIDENSGDNNYDAAYPWAVYPVHFEYMSGRQNGSLVYDGQPIEKDTDFTLSLRYSQVYVFYYWYKAQGADDSAYVLGLPADAGTYTVKVGAPYIWNSYKEYWECTFDVTIAKATPVYTTPTDLTICADHTLADIALPSGWTWKDSSVAVGEAGEKTFAAVFTPENTLNYNTVEGSVTVTVTAHTGGTATCTDKAVCSVCGMEYGELTPHVFDQKVTTEKYLASEATCTAKATYYYSCVCGEKGTETFEYGELAPHVFDLKVATAEYLASEATCTQKATYYYSCVCGEKDTETFEYGELAPHVFDQKVATAEYLASEATCTQKATYYYSCVCGEKGTETFEYGELAPHVFDQKVATAEYLASEATCTQKATYYYSCVCGEKGTETFEHGELAEHTAVEISAVEATCTQSGMTAGSKCSVCGEILVAPEEIAPLGHVDENDDELCDRCGFDMSIPEFTITVTGGTIEGAIGSTVIVEENGSVTVVAGETPEGKEFKGWSIDGGETIVSEEAAYTFTASEDTVLTAVFADKQSDVKPGGEITPENPEGLSGGAIAGIVIGSVFGALLIAYGVFALLYRKKIISGAFFGKIYPFIKD